VERPPTEGAFHCCISLTVASVEGSVEAGDVPGVSGKSAKSYYVKSTNLYEEKYS
jgi:hypothetical protein